MSLEAALTRLEKELGARMSERRSLSYTQLVRAATARRADPTITREALAALVGPPALLLRPGEQSPAEYVVEAVEAARTR